MTVKITIEGLVAEHTDVIYCDDFDYRIIKDSYVDENNEAIGAIFQVIASGVVQRSLNEGYEHYKIDETDSKYPIWGTRKIKDHTDS